MIEMSFPHPHLPHHKTGPEAHGNYDERTGTVYDANIDRWMPADEFYSHYGIPFYGDNDTKMSTKHIILLVSAAIGLLLLLIGMTTGFGSDNTDAPSSSPYTASEDMFLDKADDIVDTNGQNDNATMLVEGYEVCDRLSQGYTISELAFEAYSINENGLSYDSAYGFIALASDYLCGYNG